MENIQMNYFGNDNYKILKILSDNQVEVLGDIIIPITQQDVADLAQFSKVKTNQIINNLLNKLLIINSPLIYVQYIISFINFKQFL